MAVPIRPKPARTLTDIMAIRVVLAAIKGKLHRLHMRPDSPPAVLDWATELRARQSRLRGDLHAALRCKADMSRVEEMRGKYAVPPSSMELAAAHRLTGREVANALRELVHASMQAAAQSALRAQNVERQEESRLAAALADAAESADAAATFASPSAHKSSRSGRVIHFVWDYTPRPDHRSPQERYRAQNRRVINPAGDGTDDDDSGSWHNIVRALEDDGSERP